jgi:hypothetical protein
MCGWEEERMCGYWVVRGRRYESVGRRGEQTGGLLRDRTKECIEGRTDV